MSLPERAREPARVVTVVGGGITGLSCALDLAEGAARHRVDLRCVLVESEDRLGGKIRTERLDDLIVEAGPDSFLATKPEALALCDRLGLGGRLIAPQPGNASTFVAFGGRLRRLPGGLVLAVPSRLRPVLRSDLLSWRGKARLAADLVLPAGSGAKNSGAKNSGAENSGAEESVARFFTRRLGREAFDRLVEPLIGGIYAGDARRLSVVATVPRFAEIEREHRSLVLGVRREAASRAAGLGTAAGRSPFMTLRGGLGELVEALAPRLDRAGVEVRLGQALSGIEEFPEVPGDGRVPGDGQPRYRLLVGDGELVANAVVLAMPAPAAARILRELAPRAASLLDTIPHASAATVSLAYPAGSVPPSFRGYGFVVPAVERRDLLAATFTSWKWPGRTPDSLSLVRGYVGGVGFEALLEEDDGVIVARVRAELWRLAGVTGHPSLARVHRFEGGMPQYTVGHLGRVAAALAELPPGLFLAGASYGGVGIPDCIRAGYEVAGRILTDLVEPARSRSA